jgi:hypothetical protein
MSMMRIAFSRSCRRLGRRERPAPIRYEAGDGARFAVYAAAGSTQ